MIEIRLDVKKPLQAPISLKKLSYLGFLLSFALFSQSLLKVTFYLLLFYITT